MTGLSTWRRGSILALMTFSLFSSKAGPSIVAGTKAPLFSLPDQTGTNFNLADRKGHWTVLYFYPKDDTPGCTKQACAFRDSISVIEKLDAKVYGISKDTVESHKKFVDKYKLNFPILADADGSVIRQYGVSGLLGFAKRHTFILDPELNVAAVMTDVDPAANAADVAKRIDELKRAKN